jgi:UDPglucose--hexose-1-phosphate uridylyltransferase
LWEICETYRPLTDEWILVSPHRAGRPWQGQTENTQKPPSMDYDPTCYLCPTNVRATGEVNPRYESTFVFDNDFAALRPEVGSHRDYNLPDQLRASRYSRIVGR